MRLDAALLEEWMRDYYFETDLDIGSSGVHPYTMSEVRQLTGLSTEEIDGVLFEDSWTLGGPGVRRAVADRYAGGAVERVMVTHGSSEAIFLTMNALLSPGDEIIALDPAYQQLYGIGEALGCDVKRWSLEFGAGFRPDLDSLRDMMTPRTRMVVVNFPHNPTGLSLTPQEQRDLVAVVAERNAYLVWDAAFGEITYERPPLPDPGTWYERTISYGTLSKVYGLPGLRVGWCLASPEVLERCARVRDYVSLHLSPMVELVAERVISAGDAFIGRRRESARKNRDLLAQWVGDRPGQVGWVPPEGGVCTFVRLHEVSDTAEFCRGLAREHRVLLVPGSCFEHEGFVRLGFGAPTSELEAGLAGLATHLDTHSG
ncbi:capreomycidine synthase [Streptomyces sp. NPDC008163]|uniref:capreomycidine synthase n=1 Tax=Streptomyces sp. NPDC008163 TaxID=3364818 RepID=UPI0036F11ABF